MHLFIPNYFSFVPVHRWHANLIKRITFQPLAILAQGARLRFPLCSTVTFSTMSSQADILCIRKRMRILKGWEGSGRLNSDNLNLLAGAARKLRHSFTREEMADAHRDVWPEWFTVETVDVVLNGDFKISTWTGRYAKAKSIEQYKIENAEVIYQPLTESSEVGSSSSRCRGGCV